MTATIDPDLVKAVQQDLIALKNGVDNITSKVDDNEQKRQRALQDAVTAFEELARRVSPNRGRSTSHEAESVFLDC